MRGSADANAFRLLPRNRVGRHRRLAKGEETERDYRMIRLLHPCRTGFAMIGSAFFAGTLAAVRIWRFPPKVGAGRPLETKASLPFEFTPPNKS